MADNNANVFDKLLAQGVRAGQIPARTQQARDWFRKTASAQRLSNDRLDELAKERGTSNIHIGGMYLFKYDAKYKETLPYWDAMPLIFLWKRVDGGFYGFNVHYLQPQLRAKLMDGLYDLTNNKQFNESTRIQLNFGFLEATSKISYLKPCLKHYLSSHVIGDFTYIHPSEWDIALFMPLAQWQNSSYHKVYKQSRKMV